MLRFVGNSALLNSRQIIKKKTKKKVPVWKYPNQIEREYLTNLFLLINQWKNRMVDYIFPYIDDFVQESSFQRPPESNKVKIDSDRLDDWSDKLDNLIKAYSFQISLEETKAVQELNFTGREISNFNIKQWFKVSNSVLGIPLLQNEPYLESTINSFVKENISLIKNLKDTTVQQIDTTINRGIKQGLRHETIKKKLLKGTDLEKGVFKKVSSRAALIARDQVSKLNGQLTQLRQTGVGISLYTWVDVNDERVRKKHANMDGRLCKWSDASVFSLDGGTTWLSRSSIGGVELHPGQDYQCRCYAEPNFETLDLNLK